MKHSKFSSHKKHAGYTKIGTDLFGNDLYIRTEKKQVCNFAAKMGPRKLYKTVSGGISRGQASYGYYIFKAVDVETGKTITSFSYGNGQGFNYGKAGMVSFMSRLGYKRV